MGNKKPRDQGTPNLCQINRRVTIMSLELEKHSEQNELTCSLGYTALKCGGLAELSHGWRCVLNWGMELTSINYSQHRMRI